MSKRSSSAADFSFDKAASIREIRVTGVELQKLKKKSGTKRKKSSTANDGDEVNDEGWYRVEYTAFIDTSNGVKKVKAASTKNMEDPAKQMMEKTRAAIDSRKDDFDIDYRSGAGVYFMQYEGFWNYLWVYAEREISNKKLAAEQRSAAAKKGRQTRVEADVAKDWERGDGFKDADEKWRAKVPVLSALDNILRKISQKLKP